nr:hypothetical protein [uncultured Carboxylicivirga sp.]
MKTHYNWKKGLFSSTYEIYTNNRLVGTLKDKAFCKTSNGIINNHKYIFQTTSLFKPQTNIIDADSQKLIGNISYGTWMTKATISLSGKTYHWQYDNVWNTKWSILGPDGIALQSQSKTSSGMIEFNSENDALILCGLFITNYLLQMTVIIVAAMVPIWTTAIN